MSRVAALRARLTTPAGILVFSTVLTNVLRIANTMAMSRLLSPRDFGLAGIIMSIFFVITMVTDAGFQTFIVRHERGEESEFLDSVWTVHIGRGGMICVLVLLFSAPAGWLLDKPALIPLMAGASLFFAFDGLVSTSVYTALRQDRVRTLSMIDLIGFLIQMAAGLLSALIFRNAWAMIVALLAGAAARTVMSYLMLPQPFRKLRYDRPVVKELWTFSRVIAASSVLTMLISQFDKVVLGRLFTLEQFGVYAIATNLAGAPQMIVNSYTWRILFPAVAAAQREAPERVRETIYAGRGFIFFGYLFACGGLIGAAPLLIRILYDPRYQGAAAFLQALGVSTAVIMLARSMDAALVAMGQTEASLKINIVRIVWLAIGGVVGLAWAGPWGLVVTLGSIEVPAFAFAAYQARRSNVLNAGAELLALGTIFAGLAAGWAVELGSRLVLGH